MKGTIQDIRKEATLNLLTSDEIKASELRILVAFRDFCEDWCLRYSLCGGTLLGAVRHGGFIPWDDDIDVCMPRPDYERFISLAAEFESTNGFELAGYFGLPLDNTPFVKLLDRNIKVKASREAKESYLWVDVFPMDALPDEDAENQKLYCAVGRLRSLVMAQHSEQGRVGRTALRRTAANVLRPILRMSHADVRLTSKMNQLASKLTWGSTKHAGGLIWGMYGTSERMPYAVFESYSDIKFEGERFASISRWDEYLSGLYGDYMRLPPVDKRVNHGIEAWRCGKDGELR